MSVAFADELADLVFQQRFYDQHVGVTDEGLQRVLDSGKDLGGSMICTPDSVVFASQRFSSFGARLLQTSSFTSTIERSEWEVEGLGQQEIRRIVD